MAALSARRGLFMQNTFITDEERTFLLTPERIYTRKELPRVDNKNGEKKLYLVHNGCNDDGEHYLFYTPEADRLEYDNRKKTFACTDYGEHPTIEEADKEAQERCASLLRDFIKGEATPKSFTTDWWYSEGIKEYGLPCLVKGGRKYQGHAVLIGYKESEFNFHSVWSARVWTGERVEYVNPRFLHIDQQGLLGRMYAEVDGMDFEEVLRVVRQTWKARGFTARRALLSLILPLEYVALPEQTIEERHKGLRRWVAQKFDYESEAEQERITHRIMLKKYGKDVETVNAAE